MAFWQNLLAPSSVLNNALSTVVKLSAPEGLPWFVLSHTSEALVAPRAEAKILSLSAFPSKHPLLQNSKIWHFLDLRENLNKMWCFGRKPQNTTQFSGFCLATNCMPLGKSFNLSRLQFIQVKGYRPWFNNRNSDWILMLKSKKYWANGISIVEMQRGDHPSCLIILSHVTYIVLAFVITL